MKTYIHLWHVTEFFLEWGMFHTKFVETKHILCSKTFSQKFCPYKMWASMVQSDRPQMTTCHMHFASWVTTASDMLRIAILIAFPWQQWLCECVSMIRYMYSACIVYLYQKVIPAFWDMNPCQVVNSYQHFTRTCRRHFQDPGFQVFSEISASIY